MKKVLTFLGMLLFALPAVAQAPPNPAPTSVLAGQVVVSATTSSSRVVLPSTALLATALTVYNKGAVDAFFALGDVTVTATVSSTIIPAGTRITVWKGTNTYIAGITASSTASLVVYQSNGPLEFGQVGTGGGGGGSGTVTSVTGAAGLFCSPNPIVTTGTCAATYLNNPQVGTTYTIGSGSFGTDGGVIVTGNNASAQTFTFPASTATNFTAGYSTDIGEIGAGALTASSASSFVPAAPVLNKGQSATLTSLGASGWLVNGVSMPYLVADQVLGNWSGFAGWPAGQTMPACTNDSAHASIYTPTDHTWHCASLPGGGGSTSITAVAASGLVVSPSPITGTGTVGTTGVLNDLAAGTYAQGDVFYYNGTNIVNLGHGTTGQFLTTNGAAANPSWTTSTTTGCPTSGCTFTGQVVTNNTGTASAPDLGVGGTNVGFNHGTNIVEWIASGAAGGFLGNKTLVVGNTASKNNWGGGSTNPSSQFLEVASGTNNNGIAIFSGNSNTSTPATLFMGKTGSATIGNNTAISSTDQIARQFFDGADGTNLVNGAAIEVDASGTIATGQIPSTLSFWTAGDTGTLTKAFALDNHQHMMASGNAPTCTACGLGGTIAGNDNAGRVTLGTAPGTTVTLTFAASWTNAPVCTATDETAGVASLVTAVNTTSVTFTDLTYSASDKVGYSCRGYL